MIVSAATWTASATPRGLSSVADLSAPNTIDEPKKTVMHHSTVERFTAAPYERYTGGGPC